MVRVASWRDGGVVRVGSAPPGRLPLRHASPHARPRRADRAASRHPAEPLDALGCSSPPRSAVEPPCRCSSGALSNRDWLPRPLRARRSRRVPSHHCGAEPLSLFDWCRAHCTEKDVGSGGQLFLLIKGFGCQNSSPLFGRLGRCSMVGAFPCCCWARLNREIAA